MQELFDRTNIVAVINLTQFGPRQIFRPAREVEEWIRKRAREHLDAKFQPGQYFGAERANAVVSHQFRFYEQLLESVLPKLCQRDEVDFLLYQYDQASELLHGKGILDLKEREAWSHVEGHFKRGIKFIIERLCMLSWTARNRASKRESILAMNIAVACAEQAVHLAQESDLIHAIFPDDAVVTVFSGGPPDFKIKAMGKHEGWAERFRARLRRDRESRSKVMDWPPFDIHTDTHRRYLDLPFVQAFGVEYGDFINVLAQTIKGSHPSLHPNDFPTLFIHYGRLLEELVKQSGLPSEVIKRALAGFTVTAENLKNEGRLVYKPKQKHRALRRGFFLMPHESGPHLAFSHEMAQENFIHLCQAVSYQKLPPEWDCPATQKGLKALSRAAGCWFEGQVSNQLRKLGIEGGRALRQVGQGQTSIRIPDDVGEIDFLGIDPVSKILVVAEAKMVNGGLEPAFWRNELDEFVRRSGCYTERFRKKVAWVSANRNQIVVALGGSFDARIGVALVTLYPSIVQEFIFDFPCVSLTELVLDYQRLRMWPYELR